MTLIAALSCSADRFFTVDSHFTADEHGDIARAAMQWETVANREIHLNGGDWKLMKQPAPAGYCGWTDRPAKTVSIDPSVELPSVTFYPTVLHEMGHTLGLQHVKHGVMAPNVGETQFSEEDLAECRRVGSCD